MSRSGGIVLFGEMVKSPPPPPLPNRKIIIKNSVQEFHGGCGGGGGDLNISPNSKICPKIHPQTRKYDVVRNYVRNATFANPML